MVEGWRPRRWRGRRHEYDGDGGGLEDANMEEMVEGWRARTGPRWRGKKMGGWRARTRRRWSRLHVHHHGMRAPELDAQNKAKLSMNLRTRRPDAHHDASIPAWGMTWLKACLLYNLVFVFSFRSQTAQQLPQVLILCWRCLDTKTKCEAPYILAPPSPQTPPSFCSLQPYVHSPCVHSPKTAKQPAGLQGTTSRLRSCHRSLPGEQNENGTRHLLRHGPRWAVNIVH
jgi:hypothetical protein